MMERKDSPMLGLPRKSMGACHCRFAFALSTRAVKPQGNVGSSTSADFQAAHMHWYRFENISSPTYVARRPCGPNVHTGLRSGAYDV